MRSNSLYEGLMLFYRYSKLNLKTMLEYKFDRTFITIAIFCREMITVAVMFLMLIRFLHIRGWWMEELLFLYSFLFLSYSLFVFLFSGIRDFVDLVYSGAFDRFLIRPRGLMFQIIAARIDFPATIGHGVVGILLFLFTVSTVQIEWTLTNSIYYLVALISGAVIQASIFMLSSTFSFWMIRSTNLRNLIFFNSRRVAGYPISFYPAIIQKFMIFVIPFAFVNYFPAQFFLQKDDIQQFWSGYMYLPPVVAILMFYLVFQFWKYGVKSYSSSGNSMY